MHQGLSRCNLEDLHHFTSFCWNSCAPIFLLFLKCQVSKRIKNCPLKLLLQQFANRLLIGLLFLAQNLLWLFYFYDNVPIYPELSLSAQLSIALFVVLGSSISLCLYWWYIILLNVLFYMITLSSFPIYECCHPRVIVGWITFLSHDLLLPIYFECCLVLY